MKYLEQTEILKAPPPDDLLVFLRKYRHFFILGHQDPDGDCLGAQMAMGRLLKKAGGETHLFSAGPFRRPEIQEYAPLFQESIPGTLKRRGLQDGDTAVLIMDCSTMERIGNTLLKDVEGFPLGIIDHHAAGEEFSQCHWIEPKVPAVSLMVHRLYRSLGIPLDQTDAECLFLGICTDTGYFRHTGEDGGAVFRTAAELTDAGVNPKEFFHKMYGNRSFESRVLLGTLLARAKSHYGGKLIVTYETLEEKDHFGPENRDSDILYQQLQAIRGCEVVLLIREENDRECSVGLRSNRHVNVGALAQRFGGGGHAKAAGFNSPLPREKLISRLVADCGKMLTGE